MKTYTYEHDATTDTWRVIEHSTKFVGLSEAEARETVERYTLMAARVKAQYESNQGAMTDVYSVLHAIA